MKPDKKILQQQGSKIAASETIEELIKTLYKIIREQFGENIIDAFAIGYEGIWKNKKGIAGKYLFYYVYEKSKANETPRLFMARYKMDDYSRPEVEVRPGVVCYNIQEPNHILFNNYPEEYKKEMEKHTKRTDLSETPPKSKVDAELRYSYLFYGIQNQLSKKRSKKLGVISLQNMEKNMLADESILTWLKDIEPHIATALTHIKSLRKRNINIFRALNKINNIVFDEKHSEEKAAEKMINILKELWQRSKSENCYLFAILDTNKEPKTLNLYFDDTFTTEKDIENKKDAGWVQFHKYFESGKDRIVYKRPREIKSEKETPVDWCFNKKERVWFNSLDEIEKKYLGMEKPTPDTQSRIYYPLKNDKKEVFGVLSVQNRGKYVYNKHDVELFEYIASVFSKVYSRKYHSKTPDKEFWKKLNNVCGKIATFQPLEFKFTNYVKKHHEDIKKIIDVKGVEISLAIRSKKRPNLAHTYYFVREKENEENKVLQYGMLEISGEISIHPLFQYFDGKTHKVYYSPDWWSETGEGWRKYYNEYGASHKKERIRPRESDDTRSVLYAPIRNIKNEIIGAISFQHLDPNVFDESHKLIIEFVARYVGVAIDSADEIIKWMPDDEYKKITLKCPDNGKKYHMEIRDIFGFREYTDDNGNKWAYVEFCHTGENIGRKFGVSDTIEEVKECECIFDTETEGWYVNLDQIAKDDFAKCTVVLNNKTPIPRMTTKKFDEMNKKKEQRKMKGK